MKDKISSALSNGNITEALEIIKSEVNHINSGEDSPDRLKEILKNNNETLRGLKIKGYIGDFPTFIEPVILTPGVKIGDTALLGPNVVIGGMSELGAFCELSNTILLDKVLLGKHCKLSYCIVDSNINLPDNYQGKNELIKLNASGKLETITI
ncbi:MAG: hypothetical protein JW891_18900 [Candidatus Lokiarchaeota archaeon]|nr:hypothetical protein [Candidatus Lokiarchaeota archaeon]